MASVTDAKFNVNREVCKIVLFMPLKHLILRTDTKQLLTTSNFMPQMKVKVYLHQQINNENIQENTNCNICARKFHKNRGLQQHLKICQRKNITKVAARQWQQIMTTMIILVPATIAMVTGI